MSVGTRVQFFMMCASERPAISAPVNAATTTPALL